MNTIELSPLENPVRAQLSIPGSKSLTNRALILAVLCKDTVIIKNPLFADDTNAMISCLKTLGIKIKIIKNSIAVAGNIFDVKEKTYTLDAKLSGTTIRFLLALSIIIPGVKLLTGNEGLRNRPITDLTKVLRTLGAKIVYSQKEGYPPIRVIESIKLKVLSVKNTEIEIKGSTSSQFLSALLMIAPAIGDISIKVTGHLVSKPYIDMTIQLMKEFGIPVINNKYKIFAVRKSDYKKKVYTVEGDYSSACYFAAIAALTNSTIIIKNINGKSHQADMEFFSILKKMGNKVIERKNSLTIIGNGVRPLKADMNNCPDQVQTLAVMAAIANGKTVITGVQTLRVKETNRIDALQKELAKMDIRTIATKKAFTIYGGNPKSATVDTYGDHRMAMSFAIAGSVLEGMEINDPEVVTKTFPDFWEELKKIGVKIRLKDKGLNANRPHPTPLLKAEGIDIKKNKIVLIGFMGAGKTSVAPLLAKKLNYIPIEMDTLILKKSGRQSIAEIIAKDGENGSNNSFRTLEYAVAKKIKNKQDTIISTGGGVVGNDELMKYLKHNAITVFLQTQYDTIQKRLIDTKERPLWKNIRSVRKLYQKRLPLYQKYADIVVETDEKSLGFIVDEIVSKLNLSLQHRNQL